MLLLFNVASEKGNKFEYKIKCASATKGAILLTSSSSGEREDADVKIRLF